MALDKQRILSELGSVVNQLQSADCGCMGKLFNGQPQESNMASLPTCGGCRRGCCQGHGYSSSPGFNMAPSSGQPNMGQFNNQHCMGRCNPPKLYADTYSYLNQNLMQPVVKEVYDDLKSITPQNTIANNPAMAAQMGLSPMQGNAGNMMANPSMEQSNAGGAMNAQPMGGMGGNMGAGGGQMNQFGGMGPQIVNMMNSMSKSGARGPGGQMGGAPGDYSGGQRDMNENANGQMTGTQQMGNMGQGQPMNNMGHTGQLMGTMAHGGQQMGGMAQGGQQMGNMISPASRQMGNIGPGGQHMGNLGTGNQQMGNMMSGQQQMGNMNANSTGQQMTTNNPPTYQMTGGQAAYGQHANSMSKFNAMFPGVMQNDLGFDPMQMAIQMNPANQQKAAMQTMQNMLTGNTNLHGKQQSNMPTGAVMPPTNAVTANYALQGNMQAPVQPATPAAAPGQQPIGGDSGQQYAPPPQDQYAQPPQEQAPPSHDPTQPTQVYAQPTQEYAQPGDKLAEAPVEYAQPPKYAQHLGNQEMFDPYTGTVMSRQPETEQPPASSPPLIREPIFPATPSQNVGMRPRAPPNYEYNTLGQPVEMLPAKDYRVDIPNLPQALWPDQPGRPKSDPMRYSNVKNTVSKTAIAGNRAIGKTPSRSHLQHMYNQYKGSQSFTQQNVAPVGAPAYAHTHSDGKLNVAQPAVQQQVRAPVERVGGDTAVVPPDNRLINKVDQVLGQGGNLQTENNPGGDTIPVKEQQPMQQFKGRNGLQDKSYSSYPTGSVAWSFHGDNKNPFSNGYRSRYMSRV